VKANGYMLHVGCERERINRVQLCETNTLPVRPVRSGTAPFLAQVRAPPSQYVGGSNALTNASVTPSFIRNSALSHSSTHESKLAS